MRIVVIGGGIVGAAIAQSLQAAGHATTLIVQGGDKAGHRIVGVVLTRAV